MRVTARPPLALIAGFPSSLCCWLIGNKRGLPVTGPQMDLKEQGAGLLCPGDLLLPGHWCSPSEQMGFQNTSP